MTPQQLIGIAVRLFAIWLAINSVDYLVPILSALGSSELRPSNRITNIIGAAYALSAAVLWIFPMSVAHRLLPRTRFENDISIHSYELARVGCSVLGLWLLARGLPTLVWFIIRSFFVVGTSSFSALSLDAKLDIAVASFDIALALVFVVGSGTFARRVVPEFKQTPGATTNDL